jgi:hypothetical protein
LKDEDESEEAEGICFVERLPPSVFTLAGGAEISRGSNLDRLPAGLLAGLEVEGLFLLSWEDMTSAKCKTQEVKKLSLMIY